MTQDIGKPSSTAEKKVNITCTAATNSNNEQLRQREKREKNNPPSKVVIRRLPPSMTEDTFLEQISPLPKHDYMYFVKADMSLGLYAFSRAYINFLSQEDIFIFKDKFDGYVFLDQKGNEYPAVVEFAPFQKIPKKKPKKKDAKCGTIEQDPDYVKFLESIQKPEEVSLPGVETYLEEIENRERELRAGGGASQAPTPLIEYLNQKKAEKQRIREEKREERKRRELEKKRQKEEERKRRRAEKEKERERDKAKEKLKEGKDKEVEKSSEDKTGKEPSVKLLRNPERDRKESDKEPVERDTAKSSQIGTDTQNIYDKGRRENPDKLTRGSLSTSRDREWDMSSDRRRRDDDKLKHKDKQRDRRDNERFKRDRDDMGKPSGRINYGRSSVEGSGYKDGLSKSTQSLRSSDWHHDRTERTVSKHHITSSHVSSSSNKAGSDRTSRGGKSYEKSRESLAKARNESKVSIVPKSTETSTVQTHGISKDDKSKLDEPVEDRSPHQSNSEKEVCESHSHKEASDVKAMAEKPLTECEKLVNDMDENAPEGKQSKEGHSRDPRSERRIRNKDRPSIELYRPGMRRLSLQRNSPQKESPSSSSSPSPTAQMLVEKHVRGDPNSKDGGSQQSTEINCLVGDLGEEMKLTDEPVAAEDDDDACSVPDEGARTDEI